MTRPNIAPENLARPEVIALTPYASARRIIAAAGCRGEVWLNANESAEGNSPESIALTPDVLARLNRYPEPQPEEVIRRYGAYAGVAEEGILVTRGGDEGIDLLVRTFCRPGVDAVLDFPPTYGMYSVAAETAGVRVERLTTDPAKNWVPDVTALSAKLDSDPTIRVVFACSPNNPTGGVLPSSVIEGLIEATRGRAILVIDEAYIDFAPEASAKNYLATAPHLVLIRTLSKAFALAGIRCGFLLGSTAVIGMLKKVIAPYPVPIPVSVIAEAVLSAEGISAMRERSARMIARRVVLAAALEKLPTVKRVVLGAGNFLLVRFTDAATSRMLYLALRKKGVIVREQASQPGLADALRVTVGTAEENALLLQLLVDFSNAPKKDL